MERELLAYISACISQASEWVRALPGSSSSKALPPECCHRGHEVNPRLLPPPTSENASQALERLGGLPCPSGCRCPDAGLANGLGEEAELGP